jgi:hypothetical protein
MISALSLYHGGLELNLQYLQDRPFLLVGLSYSRKLSITVALK